MGEILLSDKSVTPTNEIIFSIIGDMELLWKQTFSYLFDNYKDITVEWKYSNCGKEWFCQGLKKKKSLFWVQIRNKNSFSIGFPFGDKVESIILQSNLPEPIKNDFIHDKRFSTTRYIPIEVKDATDFESVKILIDIKSIIDHLSTL